MTHKPLTKKPQSTAASFFRLHCLINSSDLTNIITTLQALNNSNPQDTTLVGGFILKTNSFSDTILNFEARYTYNLNLYTYDLVYHSNPSILIPSHFNSYDDISESILAFKLLVIESNHFLDTIQLISQTPDRHGYEEYVYDVPCRLKRKLETIS